MGLSKSMVAGALVAVGWLAPAAAARADTLLLLQPAAGAPGAEVAVSGSGFGRGAAVRLTVAGQPAQRLRAGAHGRIRARVTVPATASGSVRVTARAGKRRVSALLSASASPTARQTSEAATGRGARLRWAPNAAAAGAGVRLRAYALAPRRRVTVAFAGGPAERVRTGRRGGFRATVAVPEVAPGPVRLAVTGAGARLGLPFTVLPDPVVAGAGDIACGAASSSAQCHDAATSELLLQMAPAAVLALGDVQYELGRYDDFTRFYDATWGRLKAITHPVVGNHEYGTSDSNGCGYACGYFDYFNGPGQVFGPAGARGAGYYAFDVGAWRLYAINSNCTRTGAPGCAAGSEQQRWLAADLARHPRRCSLMFMHHPLFTSDTRDFDNEGFRTQLRPLWQTFYDAGGELVLTGHSHFYERYAKQDPQERPDPARGIRQIIAGTGGRNVYGVGSVEPTSEVRGERTFGVIRLALHASSYDWQFVPEPGKTFTDAGTDSCH